jgi:hypothetical protein
MNSVGGDVKTNRVPFDDLSDMSTSLWAKVSQTVGDVSWLPLVAHMHDAGYVS